MIELRRLRAFVTVVEEGNITRAAERLFIQQPPLTRLLQGLEDELGVTLLQRLPRGVRVTEAGGVLFEEARACWRAPNGCAKRCSAPLAASRAHRHRLHQLRRAAPVRAQPAAPLPRHPAGHHYPAGRSRQRRTDGGVAGTAPRRRLRALAGQRHSRPERGAGAQRTDDRRPAAGPPTGATNAAVAAAGRTGARGVYSLSPPGRPGLYDAILAACHRAGFSPRIVQEAPRLPATLSLVGAGLGLSVVPGSMRRLGGDGIVYRTLTEEAQLSAPLYLALRAARLRRSSSGFVSWCWRPWGVIKAQTANKNAVRLLFI